MKRYYWAGCRKVLGEGGGGVSSRKRREKTEREREKKKASSFWECVRQEEQMDTLKAQRRPATGGTTARGAAEERQKGIELAKMMPLRGDHTIGRLVFIYVYNYLLDFSFKEKGSRDVVVVTHLFPNWGTTPRQGPLCSSLVHP